MADRAVGDSYEDVVRGIKAFIKAFNDALGGKERLETRLAYYRAWYYSPELDLVGPSKFVGYLDLTPEEAMSTVGLDGKVTEPVLTRWFYRAAEGTAEYAYVMRKLTALLAEFGTFPNGLARAHIPYHWPVSSPTDSSTVDLTSNAAATTQPIVDVFYRAYLSLYPEDQTALALRIAQHAGS